MRLIPSFIIYLFCVLLLTSCEFHCNVGGNKDGSKGKTVSSSTIQKDGATITNGIDITAKGVKLKKATLLFPDKTQVSDDNMVDLNQKIKMYLLIDSGWVKKDGKVYLGASEKITSDKDDLIVNADDIFSDYATTGIDPEDAKAISLTAVISSTGDVKSDYYLVNFRLWDKNGNGEIVGSYKFHIK